MQTRLTKIPYQNIKRPSATGLKMKKRRSEMDLNSSPNQELSLEENEQQHEKKIQVPLLTT